MTEKTEHNQKQDDLSLANQYGGKKLKIPQVRSYLLKAGFRNDEKLLRSMICTAFNESSFWTEAFNANTNGSFDVGLFQINDIHTPKDMTKAEFREKLKDPVYNTKTALRIYNLQGLKAWYGWRAKCNTEHKVTKQLIVLN